MQRGSGSAGQQRGKRLADLVLACLVAAPALAVLALAAVAVRLTSPGPVILRQQRHGVGGELFTMYKLRTMGIDASSSPAAAVTTDAMKLEDDPRITRVGRWLRWTSIDELPQLWNVLRGNMSMIGPRPCMPEQAVTAAHRRSYDVRPGITGLSQVVARDLPYPMQDRLHRWYADNWTLALDLAIVALTAREVPARAVRLFRGTHEQHLRRRYAELRNVELRNAEQQHRPAPRHNAAAATPVPAPPPSSAPTPGARAAARRGSAGASTGGRLRLSGIPVGRARGSHASRGDFLRR